MNPNQPLQRTFAERIRFVVCSWLVLATGMLTGASGQDQEQLQSFRDREAEIKAVYLYKFIKYTTWPDSAFPGDNAPLIIGLAGEHPVAAHLKKIVKGRVVKGSRPLRFIEVKDEKSASACHILFVADSLDGELAKRIMDAVRGMPVLLVGESREFPMKSGVMSLVRIDNKIRLFLSVQNAKQQKLKLSSQLAKVANLVD